MRMNIMNEIDQEYKKTGSVLRTAKKLGVGFDVVKYRVEHLKASEKPDQEPHPLDPYIVAKRRIFASWDNNSAKIKEARRNYDKGTHEMCTRRVGNLQFLLSIPRIKPVERRNYFYDAKI